jgi:hypothetical protein
VRNEEKLTVVNHYARAPGRQIHRISPTDGPDPNLLCRNVLMLWLFPVTILVIGAGALVRARLRAPSRSLSNEPVSGQWLAEARAREEQPW